MPLIHNGCFLLVSRYSIIRFLCILVFWGPRPRRKISSLSLSLSLPFLLPSVPQVCARIRTGVYYPRVVCARCARCVGCTLCGSTTARCTLIRNSQRRLAFTSDIMAGRATPLPFLSVSPSLSSAVPLFLHPLRFSSSLGPKYRLLPARRRSASARGFVFSAENGPTRNVADVIIITRASQPRP